jgi:hypothetical protein
LVGFLNLFFGGETSRSTPLPKVTVNKFFVTDAERSFFQVLRRVVGDRGHVLTQVPLRQLLFFPGNNKTNPGRASWHGRVSQRTIDFVVCDPATLRPLVAIELDDSTHSRPDRQTRDDNVHTILEAAGLPLLGVVTSRGYETRELEASLAPYLQPRPNDGRHRQR